jgi:peptidoglycan/xylan/chitin deacetylase (PgdA/CDA1 family)
MAIAITFDDGPNRTTTIQMLSLLEQLRIPATFFVLGYMVEKNPDSLKMIASSKLKHEIGNHSWSHSNFEKMSEAQLRTEITSVNDIVVKTLGKSYHPKIVRPPRGQLTKAQRAFVEGALCMKLVGWDVDPHDWSHHQTEPHIIKDILLKTSDGRVVLAHDVHPHTLEAMRTVLPKLRKKFSFETVSKLGRYTCGGLTA